MVVGNPWLCIIVIPVIFGVVIVMKAGVAPTRQAQRLMLSSKTPIFSHLSLISSGLYSIRAFNLIDNFRDRFKTYATQTTKYYLAHFGITQWMQFRLDLIGGGFVASNIILSMAAKDTLEPTTLAVGLSLTITLVINFLWVMN